MNMRRISLASILAMVLINAPLAAADQPHPVVLLDGYHNQEPKPHYRWEGTYNGGYADFGKILQALGAELRTLRDPISVDRLVGVTCLILVNPDTPVQSTNPQYISQNEIVAVREWVRAGGLLVMFGNDPGHVEFEHLNELAREFGIEFLYKKHENAQGSGHITIPIPAGNPYFGAGGSAYLVDVAPLGVTAPFAQTLMSDNNETIMSYVPFGEGRVLALGDPWVYNEHLVNEDNHALAETLFRNLFGEQTVVAADEAKPTPFDGSGVRPGPIHVDSSADAVTVSWPDEKSRTWTATFSLKTGRVPGQYGYRPLITRIAVDGKPVLEGASPVYRFQTGERRGGWDEFFDLPPSAPEGTREFWAQFAPVSASAQTVGNRVQIQFEGLKAGILQGAIRYTFYPGTRLMEQEAVVVTHEPNRALIYDAGLRVARAPGKVAFYDTKYQLQREPSTGTQWNPVNVHYRALAGAMNGGSIVVFPAPHQYFFPRDRTSNMGYVWHSAFNQVFSLGVRQLPDDNSSFYPWFSAPPGSEQHLAVFFLLSDAPAEESIAEVRKFTHSDHFIPLDGHKVVTAHWHFAYTVDEMKYGPDWIPPFKSVLKNMGVNVAALADFHGDGHARDPGPTRFDELDHFFRGCRAQSDKDFLMFPGEEADVYLGGHWIGIFPKPVYWSMVRPEGTPFEATDPKYGKVYHVGDVMDMFNLIKAENAFVWTTHPRSKGSKGFPDTYKDKDFYLDPHFFGGSWKDINIDMSSPRLGDRSLNLLNDMNNWGQRKRILDEVDVFKISSEDELYAHMNVNYVRMDHLPDFDHYGDVLPPLRRGDFFSTTGEVLLPESSIQAGADGEIVVHAHVLWTLPLRLAEIVWGDDTHTFNKIFSLQNTGPFGDQTFEWTAKAGDWKWARFAVWDVAADGAFVNPFVR